MLVRVAMHVYTGWDIMTGVIFGFAMILLYVSANSYIIDSSSYAATEKLHPCSRRLGLRRGT
jgi:hypothetical protein